MLTIPAPKKISKRAGVGIGSQSWPGLLKYEEKAGRNPGLDHLCWTAASDQPAQQEARSRRQESGWAAPGDSWMLLAPAIGHWPSAIGHRHRRRIASETKFQAARSAAGGIEKGWAGEGYNDFRAMGHMLIIIVEQKPRKIK